MSYYDEELPGGFQDADFELRELTQQANRIEAARKRGICDHGWTQGPPGPPSAPTSVYTCLHCGTVWQTEREMYIAQEDAREEIL